MKLVVLTTETLHHSWYIRALKAFYPDIQALVETTPLMASFPVVHEYERKRDEYELHNLFEGHSSAIKSICKSYEVDSVNDGLSIALLNDINPDLLITFGTRRIGPDIISKFNGRIINLHGGDPESYRGLDSHLWAIYHDDFEALVTTLHILSEGLDEGDIIQKTTLNVTKLSCLSELRALNTRACLDITVSALKSYERLRYFLAYKQRHKGRYYSFMPAALKGVCVKKFHKYLEKQ